MRVVVFAHSLVSCWNHGNAHFLRGVVREMVARGDHVTVVEPEDSWSRMNLLADQGTGAVERFAADFPGLSSILMDTAFDVEGTVEDADLVLVHEWNDAGLVARLGRLRANGGRFRLLFHDTHHRAVSEPDAIRAYDLSGYDGVLAFGAALAEVYRSWGWGDRVFVWHEAADTRLFRPPAHEGERQGLVWIGNWGDGERGAELRDFLLQPAQAAALPLDIYGVRYPDHAVAMLAEHGARYHGWLANCCAPEVFDRHMATVHVPRRFYVRALPGIPTIRVFEALACGIPLVSAPWSDAEHLFRDGDFLRAGNGEEMAAHLRALAADPAMRAELAARGLESIRARHTCAHRVDELLAILAQLRHTAKVGAA